MMLKRLYEFLQYRHISFNKFEISLGVSHGSISNAWKHNKNIGSNVIENILKSYPEISTEWLLRGKGEMLVPVNSHSSKNQEENLSIEWNELLIGQTLNFFQLESKGELQLLLNRNSKDTLEEMIISTWEQKYGQELKSLKHQVTTLFTAKLDSETRSEVANDSPNSKAV